MEKSFNGYWIYNTNTGMTMGVERKLINSNCVLLYLDFNKNVKMSSNQIYYSFIKV